MYQSKEKIQTVVLLLADLICFVISYFGGGYLWLVLYRNVSVQNMKSELMDSFGIVLVIYMAVPLLSLAKRIFAIRFATCLIRLKIWTPGGCLQRTAAPGAVFADDYTLTI